MAVISDEQLDAAARRVIPVLEAAGTLRTPAELARLEHRRLERLLANIEADARTLHRRYRATAAAIDHLDAMIGELEIRRRVGPVR